MTHIDYNEIYLANENLKFSFFQKLKNKKTCINAMKGECFLTSAVVEFILGKLIGKKKKRYTSKRVHHRIERYVKQSSLGEKSAATQMLSRLR